MKRPVLAAKKVGKLSTDLLEKCQGKTPNLRIIGLKKGHLEIEWTTFDTLYTQWADTVDEHIIDQHEGEYDDVAASKDQALETATDLIIKDDILTQGQDLISKIAVDSAGVETVLDSMFSKVSETTVASEKLAAPLAYSYSKQ